MVEITVRSTQKDMSPAEIEQGAEGVKVARYSRAQADRREFAKCLNALAFLIERGDLRLEAHNVIVLNERAD
jgi:hypothetical protein